MSNNVKLLSGLTKNKDSGYAKLHNFHLKYIKNPKSIPQKNQIKFYELTLIISNKII